MEKTYKLTSRYEWTVGDYAALKVDLPDSLGMIVPAGTIVRIEAISPKTTKSRYVPPYCDPRPYFLNSCRLGDTYPRLRHDFITIRRPKKAELLTHMRALETLALERRLKI